MTRDLLNDISSAHGNSFYLFNREKIDEVYEKLQSGLPENTHVCYSIKSNYSSEVIGHLQNLGAWFEISSQEEFNYVNRLGVNLKNVVVNSPVSYPSFIKDCLDAKSLFNIQNINQWHVVLDIAQKQPHKKINIGLRLNYTSKSRFGLSSESVKAIIDELNQVKNITIVSLHVHVCEGERSAQSFTNKRVFLEEQVKSYNLHSVKYLNVGGGFYSEMPKALKDQFSEEIPSVDDYIKALQQPSDFQLLIEPGALLVANAFTFYTKVISIERLNEETIIQVDGSIYDIMPTKSNKQLPYKVLSNSAHKLKGKVVGFTCMEDDVLIPAFEGQLEIGDWIVFSNVGSYAHNLRPRFISTEKLSLELVGNEVKQIDINKGI